MTTTAWAARDADEAMEPVGPHRGLLHDEPLIFEQDEPGRTGVDLPAAPAAPLRLGDLAPRGAIGLPSLSEPQVVRHFTRLSSRNYGIDSGIYPLGSCTMKHNPRLNELVARLDGFAQVHPLQPEQTVQGALALMDELADWLLKLTGMEAVALSPAAGAHGELCGMLAIRAALDARGERRNTVLVPASAHGTNPATAAALGFGVVEIPSNERGRVDVAALRAALGPQVAAIMLTNPSTCGLFETDIVEIAEAVHAAGAYFYGDGANFNAIVGRVRPADLGLDVMHINLHKTFSTPHGGGGPGAGPTVFAHSLAPYVPLPFVRRTEHGLRLVEHAGQAGDLRPMGRLKAYHGQFGTFVRALAYILSLGGDGLRQASADAVLNANYVLARLSDVLTPAFPGPCMHEALFQDDSLREAGSSTLDLAKALLDEGMHPMTIYFPLVVKGAMLVEPTESEPKAAIDEYVTVIRRLVARLREHGPDALHHAPRHTPRRRLDEVEAAKKPVLRWTTG